MPKADEGSLSPKVNAIGAKPGATFVEPPSRAETANMVRIDRDRKPLIAIAAAVTLLALATVAITMRAL
jgi:hypothetical protein